MPENVEVDLDKIKEEAFKLISAEEETEIKHEVEPIGFGLKSLKVIFVWSEDKGSTDDLEEKIKKFEIRNIKTVVGNIIDLSKEWNLKFDKILVDPPCTALGLRPRLTLEVNRRIIVSSADYQKAILFACNKLLKPGGELVYSTCTITKEENEDVVNHALKFGLEIIHQPNNVSTLGSISTEIPLPVQRFIPGQDKTLGFFIAKLKKPGS